MGKSFRAAEKEKENDISFRRIESSIPRIGEPRFFITASDAWWHCMMRLASAKRKESEIENAENFISRLEFEGGIR